MRLEIPGNRMQIPDMTTSVVCGAIFCMSAVIIVNLFSLPQLISSCCFCPISSFIRCHYGFLVLWCLIFGCVWFYYIVLLSIVICLETGEIMYPEGRFYNPLNNHNSSQFFSSRINFLSVLPFHTLSALPEGEFLLIQTQWFSALHVVVSKAN